MTEQLRTLGTSGLEISPLGLGAWAMGGSPAGGPWGPQDDTDSIATIHRAVELGVNWIDTASVYGLGHSEDVVGRALRELPEAERPLVFTKCRPELVDDESAAAEPADIRAELEQSLRRLHMDCVDLYQVHWPPRQAPTPLEEYWATMVELRREGKARAIGLSNHDVAQLEAAEVIGHVDSLQPHFSAVVRTSAEEITWCRANGTGVIVYSPMHHGVLTGAFTAERLGVLAADDWRRTEPKFVEGLPAKLELAEALAPIADRHGVSRAAVAVAWTLAWPGVTGAIVGARRPEQVDGWIEGADLALAPEDLDEIAAAIDRTGAGEGPARPPA
jgi:aryl-alcohol dehydrogenase-like predicted oxidoreductase